MKKALMISALALVMTITLWPVHAHALELVPGGYGADTLAMMRETMKNQPDLTHDVKRVIIGDGDLVAVHHHFRRRKDEPGYAVVDILRIAGGYVVEHWDVIQDMPDPAHAKNSNGMF